MKMARAPGEGGTRRARVHGLTDHEWTGNRGRTLDSGQWQQAIRDPLLVQSSVPFSHSPPQTPPTTTTTAPSAPSTHAEFERDTPSRHRRQPLTRFPPSCIAYRGLPRRPPLSLSVSPFPGSNRRVEAETAKSFHPVSLPTSGQQSGQQPHRNNEPISHSSSTPYFFPSHLQLVPPTLDRSRHRSVHHRPSRGAVAWPADLDRKVLLSMRLLGYPPRRQE